MSKALLARRRLLPFAFAFLLALFPGSLAAATLSFDPASGTYAIGDTFMLTVRLGLSPDECINAAHVEIAYPTERIKASAFSTGESLFTLFTEGPNIDHEQGVVSFDGGIPGGYCGRIQGDPGQTNILGRLILSIPGNMVGGSPEDAEGTFDIMFAPGTQVLLNDGLGTPATLALSGGRYRRLNESTGQKNEWLDLVRTDTIPPEPFTVSVLSDSQVFDGRHFIVFATVDKQSGIDHFEVMEDDPERPGFLRSSSKKSLSVTATSPYLLSDQTLKSRITVRAFDHAGNVRETVEMSVGATPKSSADLSVFADWRVLLPPVLAIAALFLYRFIRSRRGSGEEVQVNDKSDLT